VRTISAAAASGNHVVHAILPPKLAPLLRERPDITLEFGARYMLRDSMADRFDAGARPGNTIAREMVARPRPGAAHVGAGRLVRVLRDWCPPFAGCNPYPTRPPPSPAVARVVEALRC